MPEVAIKTAVGGTMGVAIELGEDFRQLGQGLLGELLFHGDFGAIKTICCYLRTAGEGSPLYRFSDGLTFTLTVTGNPSPAELPTRHDDPVDELLN
jgi:hypothetical protein